MDRRELKEGDFFTAQPVVEIADRQSLAPVVGKLKETSRGFGQRLTYVVSTRRVHGEAQLPFFVKPVEIAVNSAAAGAQRGPGEITALLLLPELVEVGGCQVGKL